jgi:hypothetical protein
MDLSLETRISEFRDELVIRDTNNAEKANALTEGKKTSYKNILRNFGVKSDIMANIVAFNATVKSIVIEVEKFDKTEQESILAYLRAKRLQKQPRRNISVRQKPLSMASIDAIKHKSRQGAGK